MCNSLIPKYGTYLIQFYGLSIVLVQHLKKRITEILVSLINSDMASKKGGVKSKVTESISVMYSYDINDLTTSMPNRHR